MLSFNYLASALGQASLLQTCHMLAYVNNVRLCVLRMFSLRTVRTSHYSTFITYVLIFVHKCAHSNPNPNPIRVIVLHKLALALTLSGLLYNITINLKRLQKIHHRV